jgi:hypothetical protein
VLLLLPLLLWSPLCLLTLHSHPLLLLLPLLLLSLLRLLMLHPYELLLLLLLSLPWLLNLHLHALMLPSCSRLPQQQAHQP